MAAPIRARNTILSRLARRHARELVALKRREAELLFRRIGITFAVYTAGGDPERLIPFDIIPRVLDRRNGAISLPGWWQRVRALNASSATSTTRARSCAPARLPETLILHNECVPRRDAGFPAAQGVYTTSPA